jgi:hypothetical protein
MQQQQKNYAEPWLSAMKMLKSYDKAASLNDWDAAKMAARQLKLLAHELADCAKGNQLPGRWETD